MQQQDYILRQIEQFGTVLRALVARLIGAPSGGPDLEQVEKLNDELTEETGINLNKVLELEDGELRDYLFEHLKSAEVFDELSSYLFEMGKVLLPIDQNSANEHLNKSLQIMDLCDRETGITSFSRENRRQEIRVLLNR